MRTDRHDTSDDKTTGKSMGVYYDSAAEHSFIEVI